MFVGRPAMQKASRLTTAPVTAASSEPDAYRRAVQMRKAAVD
jgi:hypothetical protein